MANEDAHSAIVAYYDHEREKTGNGYPTVSCGGERVGASLPCSRVPAGVTMTDVAFLKLMRAVSSAIDSMRMREYKAYTYIELRYEREMSLDKIADLMGVSERQCRRYNEIAEETVLKYM